MTHYWWMHWFWITACACSASCNSDTTEDYPANRHLPVTNESYTRTPKAIVGSSYIPPVSSTPAKAQTNATAPADEKFDKSKMDWLPLNATANPTLFKETTVIDRNDTDYGLNNADNQTAISSSFNAINHENLTLIGEDRSSGNHTDFLSPERVGLDGEKAPSGSLSAAGITGITFACIAVVGAVCALSFFMYRNRGFNRPQVLNDRCSNPDSSGYIDDASVRDNSEEMYSLDNDSFLNSLEAMTIQNYFTDTVKHTKL